jgi:hypothetical protein
VRRYWAIAATIAGILMMGCSAEFSAGRTLDTQELEGEIATGLSEQTGITATIECPEDVPLEQGNEFECTAQAEDGTTAQIAVTQNDNEGNVSWRLLN